MTICFFLETQRRERHKKARNQEPEGNPVRSVPEQIPTEPVVRPRPQIRLLSHTNRVSKDLAHHHQAQDDPVQRHADR